MKSPEGTPFDPPQQGASALHAAKSALDPARSELSKAASVVERLDARIEASEKLEQTRKATVAAMQYVRDKPLLAVGIAAGVGLVAGLLARRRH